MKSTNITYNPYDFDPAVQWALKHYNSQVDIALEAVKKIEAICITEKLGKMFWVADSQTAELIKNDYLVAA